MATASAKMEIEGTPIQPHKENAKAFLGAKNVLE
jgi:hypothetical protein